MNSTQINTDSNYLLGVINSQFGAENVHDTPIRDANLIPPQGAVFWSLAEYAPQQVKRGNPHDQIAINVSILMKTSLPLREKTAIIDKIVSWRNFANRVEVNEIENDFNMGITFCTVTVGGLIDRIIGETP